MQQGPPKKLYLGDLSIQPIASAICVRVMRKWNYNGNEPGAPIRYIGLVLADEKGEAMYAQILQQDVAKLGEKLQLDKVYMISNFNVRVSKTNYVPFNKKLMIELCQYTTIKTVQDPPQTFPTMVYNITPYRNIMPVGQAQYKLYDVLGIITSVGNPEPKHLMQRDRVATIREVFLTDADGEKFKVTLWDECAVEFALPDNSASDGPQSLVILFVGCTAKLISNVTQLSAGDSSSWFFNPQIKEAQPLYSRLSLSPVPIHRPPPQIAAPISPATPSKIPHKTLAELYALNPFEFLQGGFKCTVTIVSIDENKRWYYLGCAKCKKSIEHETVPFVCPRCEWRETKDLYTLTLTAEDETGQALFFAYDENSRKIIRKNIEYVLREARKTGGYPQPIRDCVSRKYTFWVSVTEDTFRGMGPRTYLIKGVPTDHEQEALRQRKLQLAQTHGTIHSPSISPLAATSPSRLAIMSPPQPTMTDIGQLPGTARTPPPPIGVEETPPNTYARPAAEGTLPPKKLFADEGSPNKTMTDASGTVLPTSRPTESAEARSSTHGEHGKLDDSDTDSTNIDDPSLKKTVVSDTVGQIMDDPRTAPEDVSPNRRKSKRARIQSAGEHSKSKGCKSAADADHN